jgi:disulfide bond formation protein DsbB
MGMAETAIPRALHQQTESRLPWFAGLVATLALALGAFWFSLGYLYSPEN